MVAHRILFFSVQIAAGGVGEPLQYWVLQKGATRRPDAAEVEAIKDTVRLWSEMEKDGLGKALGGGT